MELGIGIADSVFLYPVSVLADSCADSFNRKTAEQWRSQIIEIVNLNSGRVHSCPVPYLNFHNKNPFKMLHSTF